MTKILVVDNYSVELCRAHPKHLFVFGDNRVRKGSRQGQGQAVIRYEKNSIGIAVKNFPSNKPQAFFQDRPDEIACMKNDLRAVSFQKENSYWEQIVFPINGIGTGRQNLKNASPLAWNILCECLLDEFEIDQRGL